MYERAASVLQLVGLGPYNPEESPLGQRMLDYKKRHLEGKKGGRSMIL
jgi:hypothetical protein